MSLSKSETANKKFVRAKAKSKEAVTKVTDDDDDDFFDQLVSEATKAKDDFIVPSDENEPLLQVSQYITMPEEIAELIGVAGVPCGLITEVYGAPDSGKTTFCNEVLRQTQEAGGAAILFLVEQKYDLHRAADMGINVKRMLVKKPKTIEQVGEYIFDVVSYVRKIKSEKPICIVWDSLGATPCDKDLNEKRADFAADQAAAITVVLRKVQGLIRETNIAFVIINQISTKIGVTFGKKTQSKGGYAPKYYSALRIEFSKIGRLRAHDDGKESDFCAIKSHVEVEKNHLGIPFKTAEVQIDYKGFVFGRKIERKQRAEKVHATKKGRDDGEGEADE
jgi:recombination protein RecA